MILAITHTHGESSADYSTTALQDTPARLAGGVLVRLARPCCSKPERGQAADTRRSHSCPRRNVCAESRGLQRSARQQSRREPPRLARHAAKERRTLLAPRARGGVARSCMLGGKVKKEKQTATCWCAKGCRSQERARGHARPASGRNPFVWALAPAPVGAGARVLDENGGAPELRDETRGALQKGSRQSPGPSTPWLLRRSGIWAPREPRGLEGRRRRLGRARALPLAPAPPH